MLLSHRKKDITMYAKMLKVLKNIKLTEITLARILANLFSADFRRMGVYRVAQKSKPLPNDQKIVFNSIKACH